MDSPVIKLEHIVKRYPGVVALKDVDFELRKGEAHCLLGENGAGKSTLIKVISGAIKKDSGDIWINGEKIEINSAKDAHDHGICTIYQEFNLISDMTVAENIFLGIEPTSPKIKRVDYKTMHQKARDILSELNIKLPVDAYIRNISVASRQMVEIAKALVLGKDIIIMDEPTASIGQSDTQILFGIIEKLKKQGKSIIYISHRLQELSYIVDRVTVMRDGKKIQTLNLKDTTIPKLISLMVGKELDKVKRDQHHIIKEKVLFEAKNICNASVNDVSFKLHPGEVLGFFGLLGSGRTEIMRALFGVDKIMSGNLYKNGEEIKIYSPTDAVKYKIGFITEDRKGQGLILVQSVAKNISLPNLDKYTKRFNIDKKQEFDDCNAMIKRMRIATPSEKQLAQNLSGGNQQKVVVAKWLLKDCEILLIDEPTRGIDVGAKEEMYQIIQDMAMNGKGIILVSSELDEMVRLCDKVNVVKNGKIIATLNDQEITQAALLEKTVEE